VVQPGVRVAHALLSRNDPFGGYACDGDDHWTLALVREWWAGRQRIAIWTRDVCRTWPVSGHADKRENVLGLRDYASYLDNGLETYLREYGFWLDNHRAAIQRDYSEVA
jgi:hypothetical protein